MARARRVEVGFTVGEHERDVLVVCRVSPGSPGSGPSMAGPGEPPEAPEVEIERAYYDPGPYAGPRRLWNAVHLIEELEADKAVLERLEERAIEAASEPDDEP